MHISGGYDFCINQSNSAKAGLSLFDNITTKICIFANPIADITKSNWTFGGWNYTKLDRTLPDNVTISTESTEHDYKKIVVFTIDSVTISHYGLYAMNIANQYAAPLTFELLLSPEGK